MGLGQKLLRLADRALASLDGPTVIPCCLEPNDHEFFWGMRNLPVGAAAHHLVALGTTGSGKSTLIQLFFQSIAHRFRSGRNPPEQLIIYDPKTNVIPLLAAAGLSPSDENFWILNPVDARSAAWKMGEAVQEPAYAREIARILAPREKESKAPFFADGAANLIIAVMHGLNAVEAGNWTFRDLLCALDSKEHILAVSAHNPRFGKMAANILNDHLHGAGVLSTLTTKLADFEEIAALWHNSTSRRQFSVDEFLSKPGVLVIGYDAKLKESILPANAMLLKALLGKVLQQPDSTRMRQWFFLDEFPSLKDVDFVADLLNRGRSKGASVLLGAQSLPGLNALYQPARAEELLSLCSYKTFLRVGDPSTAEWMTKYVGKVRMWEARISESSGRITTSYDYVERDAIMSSVFLSMPTPARGGEFHLVNDFPSDGGLVYTRRAADDLFSMCKGGVDERLALHRRTSFAEEFLQPWSPEQERYYCSPRATVEPADESFAQSEDDSSESVKPAALLPPITPKRTPPPLPGLQD